MNVTSSKTRTPALTAVFVALTALGAGVGPGAAPALGQDSGWTIRSFRVSVDLARDGTLDVVETIAANFEVPKHGIIREIPVRYSVHGTLYDIRLHLKSVTDAGGVSISNQVRDESNKLVIKIGDAKKVLTGEQTYVIRYKVGRAVLWEGEHAALRWNATGDGWRVPIESASVEVNLPEGVDPKRVGWRAFTGEYGSTARDATLEVRAASLRARSNRALAPREGLTVEADLPADALTRPSFWTEVAWWLADNFVLGLIPLGLAACWVSWYTLGRDLPGRGTVVVRYEPPDGLAPAEVGTLIDESVDARDVSATIIDLAVRGFLTMKEETTAGLLGIGGSTDCTFSKRKEPKGLKAYEAALYRKLFASQEVVRLSELRTKFYDVLPSVKSDLYGGLTSAGYFDGNPQGVRVRWFVFGALAGAVALGASAAIQAASIGRVFPLPLIVAGVCLLVMVGVTARVMPRRTRKGRVAWEQIRGLEEYISRAEVDDLKAQEKQNVFERLLPYAVAFGLTKKWASAFEGLYREPPDWYRTDHSGPFNMMYFGSSIDRSVGSMNTTFPTQPRSDGGGGGWSSGGFGGGGSSGGGFGGGGGSSW